MPPPPPVQVLTFLCLSGSHLCTHPTTTNRERLYSATHTMREEESTDYNYSTQHKPHGGWRFENNQLKFSHLYKPISLIPTIGLAPVHAKSWELCYGIITSQLALIGLPCSDVTSKSSRVPSLGKSALSVPILLFTSQRLVVRDRLCSPPAFPSRATSYSVGLRDSVFTPTLKYGNPPCRQLKDLHLKTIHAVRGLVSLFGDRQKKD